MGHRTTPSFIIFCELVDYACQTNRFVIIAESIIGKLKQSSIFGSKINSYLKLSSARILIHTT
jgi:hypothetical protein